MKKEDIIQIVKDKKLVVIIGKSATGKTYLSNFLEMHLKYFAFIHSDDFIEHGYEQALYAMMDELDKCEPPIIIEGVNVYRLLRKWAKYGKSVDLIIETMATPGDRIQRYIDRGDGEKLRNIDAFDSNLSKVFNDYIAIVRDQLPPIINVES